MGQIPRSEKGGAFKVTLLLTLLLLAISQANAGVIVSGGPFGVLTDAVVSVPAGGNVYSNYAETFDVTVTGVPAGDLAALYFEVDETARPFFGARGYEYEESWSSLRVASDYAAFPGWVTGMSLATSPYLPGGSTPISCDGFGNQCGVRVGASQQMTFTAESAAYYSFNPSPLQMSPTLFGPVEASVRVGPDLWLEDLSTGNLINDATVTFTPAADDPPADPPAAPEPGTAALTVAGALLVAIGRRPQGTRITCVAPATPPTTTR